MSLKIYIMCWISILIAAAYSQPVILVDPAGDWFGEYTGSSEISLDHIDISAAWVTKNGSTLVLGIAVNSYIPPHSLSSYYWDIDVDRSTQTGESTQWNNNIGADYRVAVHTSPDGRIEAEVIQMGKKVEDSLSYRISGNTVEITLPMEIIGNPPDFYWVAWTSDGAGNRDKVPDIGYGRFGSLESAATYGILHVETIPVEGKIYVDGTYVGTGTWTGSLPEGIHTVSFGEVRGYTVPSSQTVEVFGSQITNLVVEYIPVSLYKLSDFNMNGEGTYIKAEPGERITATLEYRAWDNACPGCIYQLIIGVSDSAVACVYNGIPGEYPGVIGNASFAFTAPEEPGLYTVEWAGATLYTCDDALRIFANLPRKKLGVIEVVSNHSIISVSTNLENASFEITGPLNLSGSGSSWKKVGVSPGKYTIRYRNVSGYVSPPPETKMVSAGEKVEFIGIYRDTESPQIKIEYPKDGQIFYVNPIVVRGSASDNIGIDRIEVRVNNGTWNKATGKTSWKREIILKEGWNRISVRATDTFGNNKTISIRVGYYTTTQHGWWDTSYKFRRKVVVNWQGKGKLLDYPIALNVSHDIYMNGDFSDIRFTWKGNGTEVEIPYWIKDKVNSQWALVWIRIPVIYPGTSELYMYYGNPGAKSRSDRGKVCPGGSPDDFCYELYEDFDGTALNMSTWNTSSLQGVRVSDGVLILDPPGGDSCSPRVWTNRKFGSNIIVEFRERGHDYGSWKVQAFGLAEKIRCSDFGFRSYSVIPHANVIGFQTDPDTPNTYAGARGESSDFFKIKIPAWSDTWQDFKIVWTDSKIEFWHTGIKIGEGSYSGYIPRKRLHLFFGYQFAGTKTVQIDWIRVRKYSDIRITYSIKDREARSGLSMIYIRFERIIEALKNMIKFSNELLTRAF